MRALVLCWLLCGCATPPVAELPEAPAADSIFLVSQGWHTGIAVRRADIPDPLLPEKRDFPGARYLEVGWGERDFYRAGTAGPWLAFKAVLFANRSVLHVAGVPGDLAILFPRSEIVEIRLSRPALEGLLRHVHDAIERAGPGARPSICCAIATSGRRRRCALPACRCATRSRWQASWRRCGRCAPAERDAALQPKITLGSQVANSGKYARITSIRSCSITNGITPR